MYIDRPLIEYLDDLAAKIPAPGGGSACALTASIGASLMIMVGNFTVGKPEYRDVRDKVSGILKETQEFSSQARALIDRDVEAYKRLSNAIKGRARDDAKLDGFYKEAIEPPYMVSKIASGCMKLCRELVGCGNKNLATDTAMAALLFESAFSSAKFNVYVNLKYIKDMEYIAKIHNELKALEETVPVLREEIVEICEDFISD